MSAQRVDFHIQFIAVAVPALNLGLAWARKNSEVPPPANHDLMAYVPQ